MNPLLLEHYKNELSHVREMGGEFAAEFPKIAGRLGIETMECTDPYVERLLEGFAFLAARVQLKIEDSHGQLARNLLEMVYPNAVAPIPSMCVTEFIPSLDEGSLTQGFPIERGARLYSPRAPDEKTRVEYRTAHDVQLWPIRVDAVRSLNSNAAMKAAGIRGSGKAVSALLVELESTDGMDFKDLPLETLSFYCAGTDDTGFKLYEQLFRHTVDIAVLDDKTQIVLPAAHCRLETQGFSDDEALMPVVKSGFQGYRLIQEYFACPTRFLFANVTGLKPYVSRVQGNRCSLVFLFDNANIDFLESITVKNLKLHCVPVINLFEKSLDRVHLREAQHEYHLVTDRARPMDFEVYSVEEVEGHGGRGSDDQRFQAYFCVNEKRRFANAFYSVRREPRKLSGRQKRLGTRSSYVGSEMFLSIVDSDNAPHHSNLRQLSVKALCTNRDLPLQLAMGRGDTDFELDVGAPLDSIRIIHEPTRPKPSRAHYRDAWRLVSALSVNYLSIDDSEDGRHAAGLLRQMLEVNLDSNSDTHRRQLEGIVSLKTEPVVRKRVRGGHIEIAHGIQIRLLCDESAFEGLGVYLFGSVMERFFTRYASINSFSETVLESVQRRELKRWPVRLGDRSSL